MGMTIENHIEQLKKLKSFHNGSYGASIKVAIDTMCKYQEQTKHLKALQRRCLALTSGTMCLFCPMECVARKEVEDGNDNI